MKPKHDYYSKIIELLKNLKKNYPNYEFSTHITTATADYEDVGGLTDRQLYDLLVKYEFDLGVDANLIAPESDVDRILREGLSLDTLLDEEDDEY